jgi:hypothetical protein
MSHSTPLQKPKWYKMYGLAAYNLMLPSITVAPPSGQTNVTRNPQPNSETAKCGVPFASQHYTNDVYLACSYWATISIINDFLVTWHVVTSWQVIAHSDMGSRPGDWVLMLCCQKSQRNNTGDRQTGDQKRNVWKKRTRLQQALSKYHPWVPRNRKGKRHIPKP